MVKRHFKLCYRVHVADLKESPVPWATLPPWSLEILTGPCSQKAHSQSFLLHSKIIHHQRLDMSRNSGPFSPHRPFSQLGGTGLYCKHGVSAPQGKDPSDLFTHLFGGLGQVPLSAPSSSPFAGDSSLAMHWESLGGISPLLQGL